MKSKSLGSVDVIYAYCGPELQAGNWYYSEGSQYTAPSHDANSGPRCKSCQKVIDRTGVNTYCGRPTPIGYVRGLPDG